MNRWSFYFYLSTARSQVRAPLSKNLSFIDREEVRLSLKRVLLSAVGSITKREQLITGDRMMVLAGIIYASVKRDIKFMKSLKPLSSYSLFHLIQISKSPASHSPLTAD